MIVSCVDVCVTCNKRLNTIQVALHCSGYERTKSQSFLRVDIGVMSNQHLHTFGVAIKCRIHKRRPAILVRCVYGCSFGKHRLDTTEFTLCSSLHECRLTDIILNATRH